MYNRNEVVVFLYFSGFAIIMCYKKQKCVYAVSYTHLLLKYINIREAKRRRPGKSENTSRKLASFDYNINGQPVCLKTLLNAFSITARRIQVLQSKIKEGQVAPKDLRGLHLNRPHAVDDDVRQLVREHIKTVPVTLLSLIHI